MSTSERIGAGQFALPFSPAAFPHVANAAARMLGLPIVFSSPRFKAVVITGVTGVQAEMTFGRCATAYVFAQTRKAPAVSVELDCAPTLESAKIGMFGWRALIKTINFEAADSEREAAFAKMEAGIKPGGTYALALGGVDYRLNWIKETVLQLIATPRVNPPVQEIR